MQSESKVVRAPLAIFDQQHPPVAELVDVCVHCGFCLSSCPTHVLWGEEMDSPRGRIYLMKMGLEGQAHLNETYVRHFDQCLGCMSCVTACPSGVQYDKLIEATRSQIERNYQRKLSDTLFRRLLFALFPHPSRLRLLAGPLWFYQRSGLQQLVRRSGLLKLLPERLRAMEGLMPPLTRKQLSARLPARVPAEGTTRGRVGLVLGCVQQVFFSDVNAATARVLAAEGFDVLIPQAQGCCGALMVHAGEEQQAMAMARQMIDMFARTDVEMIVINAAGCGSTLKEYAHLLRDDPHYAERAQAFVAKCKDISEVLAAITPRAARYPLPLKVAYHDACHLQHAQHIRVEPRTVLKAIPGLEILEPDEATLCCGSGGIYNLVQPETAQELGDRKVKNLLATGAEAIVSSNPGCLLQIVQGLERAGHPLPVLHMVELVDASIRGVSPIAQKR